MTKPPMNAASAPMTTSVGSARQTSAAISRNSGPPMTPIHASRDGRSVEVIGGGSGGTKRSCGSSGSPALGIDRRRRRRERRCRPASDGAGRGGAAGIASSGASSSGTSAAGGSSGRTSSAAGHGPGARRSRRAEVGDDGRERGVDVELGLVRALVRVDVAGAVAVAVAGHVAPSAGSVADGCVAPESRATKAIDSFSIRSASLSSVATW